VARVVDLAGEVLEEAVELVEVAVGDRQELRRVGGRRVDARDRAHLELQLVAEPLDAPGDPHEVAALEAPREHVGVAKDARRDRAGAVAQLEREVRRARPRDQPILARAREDAHGGLARAPGRSVATASAGSVASVAMGPSCTVNRMQPLIWDRRPDGLRAPALICAFTGWNDAGDAASAALSMIGSSLGATRFARVDPEDFF